MIGAFSSGFLANRVGRKRAILLSHIPAFIGAVVQWLCVYANSPELLIIGRFIQGLNCGKSSGVVRAMAYVPVVKKALISLQ